MPRPRSPEAAARAALLGIAAGRIAIGAGAFGLTRTALVALGFDRPEGGTVALARLAGSRDVALGIHTLAAARDRKRLREAGALGAAVDAADAIAFAAALFGRDGIDRTALLNAPLGAVAAAVGGWALRRL